MRSFFKASAMMFLVLGCSSRFSLAEADEMTGAAGQGGESDRSIMRGGASAIAMAGRSAHVSGGGRTTSSARDGGTDGGEPASLIDAGSGGESDSSAGGSSAGSSGQSSASGGAGQSSSTGGLAGSDSGSVSGTSASGGTGGMEPTEPCTNGVRVQMESPDPGRYVTRADAAVSPEVALTPDVCIASDDLNDNIQVYECCLLKETPPSGTVVYWNFRFSDGGTLCTNNWDTALGCGPMYRYNAWVNGDSLSVGTSFLPGCNTNGCYWALSITIP